MCSAIYRRHSFWCIDDKLDTILCLLCVFIVCVQADTLVYQWCCIYSLGLLGEHQHWSSNWASASGRDLRKRCWILRARWAGLWVPPPSSIFRLLSRNDCSATQGAWYKEPDPRRAIDHIKARKAAAWIMKCWLWRKTAGQKTTKYESWRAANNKTTDDVIFSCPVLAPLFDDFCEPFIILITHSIESD